MFDVFTRIEVMIKDGIANLYWYKNDSKKGMVTLRAGLKNGRRTSYRFKIARATSCQSE